MIDYKKVMEEHIKHLKQKETDYQVEQNKYKIDSYNYGFYGGMAFSVRAEINDLSKMFGVELWVSLKLEIM